MPIDLAAIKKQQEDALSAALAGRSQAMDAGLASTKSSVEAGREAFFGNNVNPLAARLGNDYGVNLGGAVSASNELYKNKLGQALSGTLASQRLAGNQDRVGLQWNNAYRRAMEAKASEQEARQYAYQVANQAQQQDFQASENAKNNALAQREADLKDQYAQMGLQQQAGSDNQTADDAYQQAMIRALFGLAGSGIAGYGLYKMNQPAVGYQPNKSITFRQNLADNSGNSLLARSGFTPVQRPTYPAM